MVNRTIHLIWNALLLLAFFVRAGLINATTKDPERRRKRLVASMNRFCKKFRRALGLKITVNGADILRSMKSEKYLLVANHVSYLDVIILGHLEQLVFITSVEMGEDGVMGPITRNGGCLFTDRKKFVSLPDEIQRFARCVSAGNKVVLFPEGTSTNGDTVQAFKGSLFQVAVPAEAPVLPVCVRYITIDGKPLDTGNRDTAFWYGDMTFMPHFLKLMGRKIEIEVNILPPVMYDKSRNRGQLSDIVHGMLLKCYTSYPPIS